VRSLGIKNQRLGERSGPDQFNLIIQRKIEEQYFSIKNSLPFQANQAKYNFCLAELLLKEIF
jgi:hypothetical protein